mmetsp:Transcript_16377/g.37896  ORF Transcript_16377/g.37896 Transcript_16377/m.37896 type:complete len:136 (+) Transcript_16377:1-408(+)
MKEISRTRSASISRHSMKQLFSPARLVSDHSMPRNWQKWPVILTLWITKEDRTSGSHEDNNRYFARGTLFWLSARRPTELTTTQHVNVKVINALCAMLAVVDNKTETFRTFFLPNTLGHIHKVPEQGLLVLPRTT